MATITEKSIWTREGYMEMAFKIMAADPKIKWKEVWQKMEQKVYHKFGTYKYAELATFYTNKWRYQKEFEEMKGI